MESAIRCGRCLTANRDTRRFCRACGAALPGACARCGFVNRADERWCGGCGTLLGVADAAERRQLSVLFCDLVGSTALSTRVDPEDLRELITAYQAACVAEITRYDGFVARYFGDGILAYFGWPHAREDAAERAVRGGLAIVRAVHRRQADLQRLLGDPHESLEVRVGIATGQVVVGDLIGEGASEERAVVGETPNLAARLQSLAGPDEVVVADATMGLVGRLFDAVDLGEHVLKGFTHAVRAHRVVGARAVASRFSATRTDLPPLVGREAELGALLGAWRAVGDGGGAVVQIVADAGFGKSRLVEALHAEVAGPRTRWTTLQGSPLHTTTPYQPVIEQLTRELEEGAALATLGEALDPDALRAVALLLGEPDPEPEQPPPSRAALAKACADALLRSAEGPSVVVVEDAQWLDPSTSEVVEALAARAASAPLLLVITERRTDASPRPDSAVRVQLERLDATAARRLADAVANGALGDADLVSELVSDRAQARSALDHLVRDRVLVTTSDLGRLAFRHTLVQDLAYRTLLRRRRRQLHRSAGELVAERGGQPEVIAQHMELAELDLEAASWWEKASDSAMQRAATREAVAHLRRAWDAVRRLPDGEDVARRRVHVATSLASALRVMDGAVEGLELIECAQKEVATAALGDTREIAEMWVCEGNLRFWTGDHAGCARAHGDGLRVARAVGATDVEARALGGLGDAAYAVMDIEGALGHFRQCVALASRYGHVATEAANAPMIAFCLLFDLDLVGAEREAERARALAASVRAFRAECLALMSLGFALSFQGEHGRARPFVERGVDLSNRLGARLFRFEGAYILARSSGGPSGAARHLADLQRDVGGHVPFAVEPFYRPIEAHAAGWSPETVRSLLQVLESRSWPPFMVHFLAWDLLDGVLSVRDADAVEAALTGCEAVLDVSIRYSARAVGRARAWLALLRTGTEQAREALRYERDEAARHGFRIILPVLDAILATA